MALRMLRLLFQTQHLQCLLGSLRFVLHFLELHHSIRTRICYFVAEDAGTALRLHFRYRLLEHAAEMLAVKHIIAQNQTTRLAVQKLFAQHKSLRQSVRHQLNFILQFHSQTASVA